MSESLNAVTYLAPCLSSELPPPARAGQAVVGAEAGESGWGWGRKGAKLGGEGEEGTHRGCVCVGGEFISNATC